MTEDILNTILTFIYTSGHWLGEKIVGLIQSTLSVAVPQNTADAIGLLAILTIFLAIAEVAKKALWVIVAVGWVLIVLKIVMLLVG